MKFGYLLGLPLGAILVVLFCVLIRNLHVKAEVMQLSAYYAASTNDCYYKIHGKYVKAGELV